MVDSVMDKPLLCDTCVMELERWRKTFEQSEPRDPGFCDRCGAELEEDP